MLFFKSMILFDLCYLVLYVRFLGGEEPIVGKPGKKVVKKKQAPKFVKTPSDQIELLQGQTVELLCKVVANPPAKLNWLKNQKIVSFRIYIVSILCKLF